MSSYATPDDLVARYDARDILQLVSDTGVPADAGDLGTNPVVTAAIADASAEIDAALLAGGRYTADQLSELTGSPLALLKRMTCELAMILLMERRPGLDAARLEAFDKIRGRHLERLRKGENIFALATAVAAGQPSVSGPSTLDYQEMRLIRDNAHRYYPRRRVPGE